MTPFSNSFLAQIMQRAPFQPATNYWRAVELTAVIEKALPLFQDCKALLDLGCGDGEIMRILRPYLDRAAKGTVRVTGVDLDPAEVALAKESGVYDDVLCSSADHLLLPDASVDAVFSNSVLEHVEPLETALGEAARVLRKDGVFVATVPSDIFHALLAGSWRPWISRRQYRETMDRQIALVHTWGQDKWRAELDRVGIEMLSCYPYLSRAETQRWENLTRLTGGLVYTIMGQKERPIALQRAMGMRRRFCFPLAITSLIAWCITRFIRNDNRPDLGGCFMVVGRKRGES